MKHSIPKNIRLIVYASLLSSTSLHIPIAANDTAETVKKLNEILDCVKESAKQLAQNFSTFLSPTDTRRFKEHVDDFDKTYADIKANTLLPIEALQKSLDPSNPNYKPVQQINILLHDMADIMDYIRTTLRANQAGTAFLVGLRLRNMKTDVGAKFAAFSESLNTFIENIKTIPGYEPVVVKIHEIQTELGELSKEGCLSAKQILGILRIRCKA